MLTKQRSVRAVAREMKREGRSPVVIAEEPMYVAPKQDIHFQAKTQNQREALKRLNSGTSIVALLGSAGTGKSFLACYHAAKKLKEKQVSKVYLVRPAVGVGPTVGLLPGELDEKLRHYFAQTRSHLEHFLGKGFTSYCFEKKVIEMYAVEYMRGMSLEDCIVICEESQNFTTEQIEMLFTRMGENSQLVLTGDEKQHDLKRTDVGIKKVTALIEGILNEQPDYMQDDELDTLENDVAVIRFTPDDVVRSGLCKAMVRMFYYN